MDWKPTEAEVSAAEATIVEALEDGVCSAPDGYYRPLAEATVIAAHVAWREARKPEEHAPTMTMARLARMVAVGEVFTDEQYEEVVAIPGLEGIHSATLDTGRRIVSFHYKAPV